jgi:hypothetical protein
MDQEIQKRFQYFNIPTMARDLAETLFKWHFNPSLKTEHKARSQVYRFTAVCLSLYWPFGGTRIV